MGEGTWFPGRSQEVKWGNQVLSVVDESADPCDCLAISLLESRVVTKHCPVGRLGVTKRPLLFEVPRNHNLLVLQINRV